MVKATANRSSQPPPLLLGGRYLFSREIAAGGMATVHLGRVVGAAGFRRTIAIKRLHPHLAKDPEFLSMFVDEARMAARISHPNVVPTIDVAAIDGELLLVMEYVHGESLSRLLRACHARGERIPLPVVSALLVGALTGLHAAHEARDEQGQLLGLIHRDVSPQNVLAGADGVPRVLDFGVAKAAGRIQSTRDGQIRGKVAYMAPERLIGDPIDRRADIYSATVILWEMLTGRRLFRGETEAQSFRMALAGSAQPPSALSSDVGVDLDAVTMRGLARAPEARYETALEMALALEAAVAPASTHTVGEWVRYAARDALAERARAIAEFESFSLDVPPEGGSPAPHGDDRTVDEPTTSYARSAFSYPSPPDAQLTESVSGPERTPVRTRSSRLRPAWVAAMALALGVGGSGAWWATRPTRPVSRQDSIAKAPVSSEVTPAPPAPVAAEAPTAPPRLVPAMGVAQQDAAPLGPTQTQTPSHPHGGGSRSPPSKSAASCVPPWTIDHEQIRHPKPECL